MNRYPLWKYILIIAVTIVALVYALPNLYGKDPALQISPLRTAEINDSVVLEVTGALDKAGIAHTPVVRSDGSLVVRFDNEETQLQAQAAVSEALGKSYVVALNLAPATPDWLRALRAEPMFLGLDLRGGVHFLLEVDMQAAVRKTEERYISDLRTLLRENRIHYKTITQQAEGGLLARFRDEEQRSAASDLIGGDYPDLKLESLAAEGDEYPLRLQLIETALLDSQRNALQQTITTLRKRVNELGIAEPVITQQGQNRVVVQLPGIQDTARAKDILGATATLEFRMVDEEHNVAEAEEGRVPPGSRLYADRQGQSLLIKKSIMLTGDSIIDAASGIDPSSGGPDVTITLDGKGAKIFSERTREEVGKLMATIFIENKVTTAEVNGEMVKKKETVEEVINTAVIREQLGKRFHITGLDSTAEARNLALLLRAGALAAPIEIIEERTVGPSLGQENITRGFQSTLIGFLLVVAFMVVYNRAFGMAANLALFLNFIYLIALLSILQATLTLPGIAGIVLTIGMAVDANILINTRIKEEIRNGNSPQSSIHAGYEKAFSTIADSNITTLICGLVLFSFGTGPIKGFAVTLSLGILTSMFSAIVCSRAIVNAVVGGRKLKKLWI
ncbi:MAG: protein translocase subunit SecD [Gammaproteobacteria bacterium]|nr:MAG: protein translocase subunit SecD [Gammaproteobacteria bacterium]